MSIPWQITCPHDTSSALILPARHRTSLNEAKASALGMLRPVQGNRSPASYQLQLAICSLVLAKKGGQKSWRCCFVVCYPLYDDQFGIDLQILELRGIVMQP